MPRDEVVLTTMAMGAALNRRRGLTRREDQ
jgi:hypothetical protein